MHEPYFSEIAVPRPADLNGDEWRISKLTNVVAVFGKNGSGKSRLLRALRDQNPAATHYVVAERTGELDYQPQYMYQQMNYSGRTAESQRNFSSEYRRHIVVRIQAYLTTRGNFRGVGVPPASPEIIEEYLSLVLPDFTLRLNGTGNPPYELRRASSDTMISSINELSSGEAQILLLVMDILTIASMWEIEGNKQRLLLVDEPDAHVHPDLLVRFADFLYQATKRFRLQTIIATHSTTLLAALGQFCNEHASVVYLDRTKAEIRAEPFTEILKELAACLGGHALMGPLFGVPMLLVEGDDDYRIWSQVPRHHSTSFSAIPCGGQRILQYQRALERVLGAIRSNPDSPSGYALIDGDKGKQSENPETPQQHIRFVQLNCHESENLFLADEVLQLMGLTWQDARRVIMENAHKYGQKAEALRCLVDSDRQRADIKPIINEVSEILDRKRLHWTIRVAKAIGKARPTGQIAEFLGSEVVSALWPSMPDAHVG